MRFFSAVASFFSIPGARGSLVYPRRRDDAGGRERLADVSLTSVGPSWRGSLACDALPSRLPDASLSVGAAATFRPHALAERESLGHSSTHGVRPWHGLTLLGGTALAAELAHRRGTPAVAHPHPRSPPPLLQRALPLFCGLDSDPAGESMARALIATHPSVRRRRPALHDWNVLLKARS